MVRKKILVIPSWYPSASDPVTGIFIEDQALALSSLYQVDVYIPPHVLGLRDYIAARGWECKTEEQNHVQVWRELLPVFYRLPERWKAPVSNLVSMLNFLKFILMRGKPDVIHLHVAAPAGEFALKLGGFYKIPVVLTEHGGIEPSYSSFPETFQETVHKVFQQADCLIAVSPTLAHFIEEFHPGSQPIVIGNVIRTDIFIPAPPQPHTNTRFLCIALLRQAKGINYLLEAAAHLLQRGITGFGITIGGEGPYRPELERKTSELGLTDRVHFLGELNRQQAHQQMQNCDVFVLPSLGETFGVVLGEALACGKPVISTYCGGPEFIVTPETGVLVKKGSAEELANAMSHFIRKEINFETTRIRKSVEERFGVEAFLNQISQVYESLL
jgi:glycosyltransferase involved in cell wall biosynthesis